MAGVKYPGHPTIEGGFLVQKSSPPFVMEGTQKLYAFESIDGRTKLYTPIPPGGNVERGGNPAQDFANGIVYLMTANPPVTKLTRDGTEMDIREFIRGSKKPAGYEATEEEPDRGGYPVYQHRVLVWSYEKKILNTTDVIPLSNDDFDGKGKMKDSVFKERRKYLQVVEVQNHHEIPTFFNFIGTDKPRDVFYLYKFRKGAVFSVGDPDGEWFCNDIIAVAFDCLTREQIKYVSAGWFGKKWIWGKEKAKQGKDKLDDAKASEIPFFGKYFGGKDE